MNKPQVNETLYQNDVVELDDAALANVIGGTYSGDGQYDNNGQDCNRDNQHRNRDCNRNGGLLNDLLGDLFC
ncbi:MAG TPA: hypothetical protein VGD98_20855 [Ktedonobacteraceae bacterium]